MGWKKDAWAVPLPTAAGVWESGERELWVGEWLDRWEDGCTMPRILLRGVTLGQERLNSFEEATDLGGRMNVLEGELNSVG